MYHSPQAWFKRNARLRTTGVKRKASFKLLLPWRRGGAAPGAGASKGAPRRQPAAARTSVARAVAHAVLCSGGSRRTSHGDTLIFVREE
ncbi:hypothetical protein CHLRE_17g713726v5 [Chlamydomonas reinhardtii]|uniref:Uncharacterized protein n=1 Tax=Chlamydomonas reinhardtii TaxID=3055 RepID=A0A2K3CPS4_CHLRE|nr:uncharacterized protein CHLRE_17g713726v5 [Chlamydomonas reinhardtii]PNW70292.1 hypothetical protein CHLRE_17g713726v5 [Chlamydomonas reinhardtii]